MSNKNKIKYKVRYLNMHQQQRPITPLSIYFEYSEQWRDCGRGFADLQQNRCCSCCRCFCSQTVQLLSLLCQDYPSPPLCPIHAHIHEDGSTHTPYTDVYADLLHHLVFILLFYSVFRQLFRRHCMSPTLHRDDHLRENETPDCVKLHQVHLNRTA